MSTAKANWTPKPTTTDDLDIAIGTYDSPLGDSADGGPGNNKRAAFAAQGLVAFAERVGRTEPIDQLFADLLGNLLHLADALGLRFEALLDRGTAHYEFEAGDDEAPDFTGTNLRRHFQDDKKIEPLLNEVTDAQLQVAANAVLLRNNRLGGVDLDPSDDDDFHILACNIVGLAHENRT